MKGDRTMKKIASHYIAVLTGAAILFASCAVLTIDVDVYKGPLANHEDIQTEQMAAMVIGAKPLLVELRDILEANYMKALDKEMRFRQAPPTLDEQTKKYTVWGRENLKTRLNLLRNESWYKHKYVPPDPTYYPKTNSRFLYSNADHVNNILSLYENRRPEKLTDIIYKIVARYRKSYAILQPQDMKQDIALAMNIKKEATDDPNASKLLNTYERFLSDQRCNALRVLKEILAYLQKKPPGQNSRLASFAKKYFQEKSEKEALQNVTSAAQRLLAETELADVCADEIFGLKGELRGQFVTRVKQIAKAYLDCRTALEELWLAIMNGVVYVNSRPVAGDEVSEDHTEFTVGLVKMSLEIIQPRYLAVLLDVANKKKSISEDINDLAVSLGKYPAAEPNKPHSMWAYFSMKYFLEKKLKEKPVETAYRLMAIHEFCKSALDPEKASIKQRVGKGDLGSLGYKEGWRFGLVRAPFEAAPEDDQGFDESPLPWYLSIFAWDDAVAEAKPALSELDRILPVTLSECAKEIGYIVEGAFAGGRLDEGLETLIEEYLEQAKVCDPNDKELRWARRRLSDALVRFAQKLLFVANNRSLISPPKPDPGFVPGTIRILFRGLFAEWLTDPAGDFALGGRPLLEDTNKYTLILQAVGNSIVVQADALHQERKHRELLKSHYEKEVAILADTLDRMSPVNHNSTDISSIKDTLSKYSTAKDIRTAKDVRDVWIELLEYEHDLALYYGETQRAKEINNALKAARAKREGMIFIRPAMAYLRTSFPATSLQSNPNLTWDNMLGGHMMRSIPFGPQIGEFLNPDAKRDARINAEIDKQFWQNINRVRVAGGGNTNYAVVKDDIGNWYVKGYSANPEDVIKSARNLAMFSLSAKMNTDFLKRTNRDNGGLPSTDKSDANQTAVERLYNKYKDQYNSRTLTDREHLIELLKSEMKSAIMQVWHQNDGLNEDISRLENKLDAAIELHLKKPADELKETENVTEYGSKIISALHAIRRFHNTLLTDVHNTITASASDKLLRAEKSKATREVELSKAKKIYSDFAIEKDMFAIDWNYKSAAAAEDPDNSVKKQLSDEAKDELDRAKAAFMRAEEEVEEKQAAVEAATNMFETTSIEFDTAVNAEERSIRDVTRIVREKIVALINSRIDSIKEYETAMMFIGESNKQ